MLFLTRKKNKIFFLVILLFAVSPSFAQVEKVALNLLKKYNKDGYYIITEYIKAPSKYKFGSSTVTVMKRNGFKRYIHGKKKKDVVNSLGTVVHEMNHAFTSIMAYQKIKRKDFEDEYYCFYLDNDKTIVVKLTKTVPSKKIVGKIPKRLRTFRFKTYISNSPNFQSTQLHGIYGLLDEFNSYYQGCKTDYLMYDYYLNETKAKDADWLTYLSNVNGTYYAYAEFKFYILTYLIYAQEKEKNIYDEIISNQNFKEVFNIIDSNFSNLINDYFKRRDNLLQSFNNKGVKSYIDDTYIYIGNNGVAHFMSDYNLLMKEMKFKKYTDMLSILKQ